MMELIRQWLVGVTGAAMIVAVAESITPSGTVKKVGKFVGGLVLLLAVVRPVVGLDYGAMSSALTDYQAAVAQRELELADVDQALMKTIIGEKIGAYILDKAEEVGAVCTQVEVTCTVGENAAPYPSAVVVIGNFTEKQQKELSWTIEGDLAIPVSAQTYESGEREG